MRNYQTVTEALNDLYKRGYTFDYSLLTEEDCIFCKDKSHNLNSDEFEIDEVYRFEGDTDPGDEMIVYAISSITGNNKGTLVNAFGIYSDSNNTKIVEKLHYKLKETSKPIKRAIELLQLSREHHHGLLLCWKIKTGISKNIAPERIKNYIDWFFKNHLLPHFENEEQNLFPLVDKENKHILLAIHQHNEIRQIIKSNIPGYESLQILQQKLNEHIRFEERVLFNEIQEMGVLQILEKNQNVLIETKFIDNEIDPFWK